MGNKENNTNEEYNTIDLLRIFKSLWKHIWIIVLAGLIAAMIGFLYSSFVIDPTYSSNVKLYVNNTSFSLGNTSFSISASELTAAQSLVKTYGEILNSRSTMDRIIEKAGLDYTWKELSKMITYGQANNTEIMRVTVTCKDPYEASKIANTIAEVLPERITEIIDGASMEVVDYAVPELQKVAPSITRYTGVGLLIGVLLSAALFVVLEILDDTIHDDDYILKTYNYPILGVIPDLENAGGKSYGYYYQQHSKEKN